MGSQEILEQKPNLHIRFQAKELLPHHFETPRYTLVGDYTTWTNIYLTFIFPSAGFPTFFPFNFLICLGKVPAAKFGTSSESFFFL